MVCRGGVWDTKRWPGVCLGIHGGTVRGIFFAPDRVGIRQLALGRLVGVDHEQVVHAAPEDAVDKHLAPLDADDSTCTRVCGFLFGAGPVAEDDNDFLLFVCADQGLESLDPIDECLEVGF
jgi:hypothetical protein